MSKPAKTAWYWIRSGALHGWVHAGPCCFAARLQGVDLELEPRPENWTKICPICGGRDGVAWNESD